MTLTTGYDPKSFETRIYTQWESSGVFAPADDGPAYTILLPPPNATGTLHMGHTFQTTLMEPPLRYPRLPAFRPAWLMGSTHTGTPPRLMVGPHPKTEEP